MSMTSCSRKKIIRNVSPHNPLTTCNISRKDNLETNHLKSLNNRQSFMNEFEFQNTSTYRNSEKIESFSVIENLFLSNGLEKYLSIFKYNGITLADLPYLNKEDLIDLDIPIGPRNRILHLVQSEKENQNLEKRPKTDFLRINSNVSKKSEKFSNFSKPQKSDNQDRNKDFLFSQVLSQLKDINNKQTLMMKQICENQRDISELVQYSSKHNY